MGAASVAVACLGGAAVIAGGGGGGPGAYVAVGAAGGAPSGPGAGVAPSGKVELVPLDGSGADASASSEGGEKKGGDSADGAPKGDGAGGSTGAAGAGRDAGSGGSATGGSGGSAGSSSAPAPDSGNSPSGKPSSSASGAPDAGTPSTGGPAALKVGEPVLKDADDRWCQDVTLTLTNSGGSAVRSGTATFKTHIIGALGIDWATIGSTRKLPVPIEAGEKKDKTWTVCVDSWRVPLGMHVETRDVSVTWK